MAYFTKAQSNPQFVPPNFNPNPQYPRIDIGNTLESVFDTYMRAKQAQSGENQYAIAAEARANAERDRVGAAMLNEGFDPRQVTPDVLARSQPGMTPQGPTAPGMLSPEQTENPLFGQVRAYLEKKKSAASMASQEKMLGMDKTRSEIVENKAQAVKFKTESEMAGVNRGLKAEGELRGELQALSKPFVQVRDAMGRIEASAKNPTAAGDLALIFNYMKVLDPGSTVREGEFATAQNSAGVPERIIAQYNKVKRGERLAPEQRNDFLERGRELYKSQLAIQKQQEDQYRGLSGRLGARPENVILDQSLPNFAGNQPKVRTLKDGTQVRVVSNGQGGWVEVP